MLIIGDMHVKESNIPEVDLFMERILVLAQEKEPDIIVMLGDSLDTFERVHSTALNKACEIIDNLRKIALVIHIVGNHDAGSTSFLTTNHWMNALKEWENVIVVDKVTTHTINKMTFTFCPYVPVGRFEEALNTLEEFDWKKSKCIFAHQEFSGFKMGSIVSESGDKWSTSYPPIISGHIHLNQTRKNIYYTGSSMQDSFDTSTKNIIAYVTFTHTKEKTKKSPPYELEEIDLCLPRKKIDHIDIEDVDDYELPDDETDKKLQDKIKVSITGNYQDFKALKKTKKYKDMIKKGVKVVFKPKKIDVGESVSNITKTLDIDKISNETAFSTILGEIIHSQKDSFLYQAYELVVNNKRIETDDVMYLDEGISN
jgi:predicted phosphodiesterase